jgi:hypothetical protein
MGPQNKKLKTTNHQTLQKLVLEHSKTFLYVVLLLLKSQDDL